MTNLTNPGKDTLQFAAIAWSIVAQMSALEDPNHDDHEKSSVAGWEAHCHSTHLLSHTTELGRGDLATIQCMMLQACYLFTATVACHEAAYSVVAQAVRLCHQIGLHNQTSWQDCSPFETHMRQRVFWAIYALDRNISQACKVPYLMRDSEIDVDLPLRVDDDQLGTSEELPEECPAISVVSYQHEMVRCSRLVSDVWDNVAGVKASKTLDPEFIAIMDARILYLTSTLPPSLRLELGTANLHVESSPRRFLVWQALMLRLVCRISVFPLNSLDLYDLLVLTQPVAD